MIIAHVKLNNLESKITERPRYGVDASGYGRKMPTSHLVKLPKELGIKFNLNPNLWRRVYVCCYSNIGTSYVDIKGDWIVVED